MGGGTSTGYAGKATKVDLQNHWTTKSRVLNPLHVFTTIDRKLRYGSIVGIVNFDDRRYEAFEEKAGEMHPLGIKNSIVKTTSNAVYHPTSNILVLKGEEITTEQGDLLVMGTPSGHHLTPKKSLDYSLDEAREVEGLTIITTPYFKSQVGKKLEEKPDLLTKVDAIEIHNGLAGKRANTKALKLYEKYAPELQNLGALASSDGHSAREVGSSYTEFPWINLEETVERDEVVPTLRKAISERNSRHHKQYSLWGAIEHTAILLPIIAMTTLGKKPNRGDPEALHEKDR